MGNTGYLAHYQDGFRVVDLSDVAAPRQLGFFNSWSGPAEPYGMSFYEGAIGVHVLGDRVYIADTHRGLLVFKRK